MKHLALALLLLSTQALAGPYFVGNGIRPHQSNTLPDAGGPYTGALIEDADAGLLLSNGSNWDRVVTKQLFPQCNSPTQALGYESSTLTLVCNTLTLSDGGSSGVSIITGTSPIVAVYDGGTGYDISLSTVPVTKGGTGLTAVGANQIALGVSSNTYLATSIPNCAGANSALTFNTGPQTFGCNTLLSDAGTVSTITGTAPVTAVSDGGAGVNISLTNLRQTVHSVYVNNATVGSTTYGGEVFPSQASIVTAARFRIRTAGTVGSTNATFRASDGTNNCDCAFACNSAAGNYRVACTGNCTFAASASMTYSMAGIGDCTVGPDIQGNVNIEATVTP